MEATKTIAHEIGGIQNDALRFGLHGVKSDIVGSHPLESAYQSAMKTQEEMNRKILANTYGSAFPLKMDLDKQILSRTIQWVKISSARVPDWKYAVHNVNLRSMDMADCPAYP
ncbi:hypothetical protein CMV_027873 [Castanea mollissima]|uniref:Uncharacterized protein n=1 Tax=Castanea mollissima TaxID=60419 RepID=A0A8J4Q9N1_9ROSI|nr:hypothetical protein CMV_027873 [Castanea mollissima]